MNPSAAHLGLSERMRALFERLARDGDRLFGTRRIQIVPLTFQVRESSEVSRAEIRTASRVRHVFAKVFGPRPGEDGLAATRARFQRDYGVTRHVFDAMRSTADLRTVEPIACYDDLLGVVTIEAPGQPLNVVIASHAAWPLSASRLPLLQGVLSRVGRWIAAFQRVAPDAEPSLLDLDVTREYIDVRLRRLLDLPRANFSEADRREVLAFFDRRAADVPSRDLIEVPVHGDIVPSNIVVDRDCVTVLDFGMTGRGSKYLDVARLYTQLEFYAAKPQFRPSVIARLQQAALTGFDADLDVEHPMLEICAVQHVVCHLLSHARQPGRFPASIYSAHLRRRHRRWLHERGRAAAGRGVAKRLAAESVP